MQLALNALAGLAAVLAVLLLPASTSKYTIDNKPRIKQVQQYLYDLNYDVGGIDGVNGRATQQAVREVQKKLGMPVDGEITLELLEVLRLQDFPDNWGAISVAVDFGWGTAWNYGSRAEAEDNALRRCREESRKRCKVLTVFGEPNARPPTTTMAAVTRAIRHQPPTAFRRQRTRPAPHAGKTAANRCPAAS